MHVASWFQGVHAVWSVHTCMVVPLCLLGAGRGGPLESSSLNDEVGTGERVGQRHWTWGWVVGGEEVSLTILGDGEEAHNVVLNCVHREATRGQRAGRNAGRWRHEGGEAGSADGGEACQQGAAGGGGHDGGSISRGAVGERVSARAHLDSAWPW